MSVEIATTVQLVKPDWVECVACAGRGSSGKRPFAEGGELCEYCLGRGKQPVPREPTAAEIAAYLQARPDLAVEVVDSLKIARAEEAENPGTRHERRYRYDLSRSLVPVSIVEGGGSWWYWTNRGDASGARGRVDTLDEGSRISGEALVAAGWALAGGSGR